ncbi:hypothetical protein [Oceanisphaera sp. IT1-181]|uniref:hypothetical protein n=1 Tax=Oceanisphaera sp. IT1-181 TaxID=3081199 RepID=UPI0029CA5D4B|nr:hypothetical protein [Oceanisphaera sp. IT1-181]
MFKPVALLIFSAVSIFSAPLVMASSHYKPANVCFNVLSNGTDGVDRFDTKMAKLQAKKTGKDLSACIPAKVYLNEVSNGTDGVDRFDAKMRKSREKNQLAAQQRENSADVYLNGGSNGTDGVDRFDEKMRTSRENNRSKTLGTKAPVAIMPSNGTNQSVTF